MLFLAVARLLFGKIIVETPKYEVLKSTTNYEIRKYLPNVVAQVKYTPSQFNGDKDGGFKLLANYIGVFGNPLNKAPQKIAMTTPVITKLSSEKIQMTTPVVTKSSGGEGDDEEIVMQFILPSKYTKAEEVPEPVDERVVIREEGEKKYGVVKFGGTATEEVVEEKVGKLKECLEKDGVKVVGEYLLGRFNPTWTLSRFKTNELMIPVE
ncbi:heme-binding-like protein At3g10130, chloroplastic [Apium graveolens]|uniref:heme-binding-like protein At3g10130, chloroplastic n=1 Tax=Apium graveolens TaxID=4045 RepID=UPI003D7982A3